MKIGDRLANATRLFLDTAPVIYFVERNPSYFPRVKAAFDQIDDGALTAVTSPVTLTESLVHPYRLGLNEAARSFTDLIVNGNHTTFALIEQRVSQEAAELRASYNLGLADAFQAAVALSAGCDAFLTNDAVFKRVTGLNVILLDEMETEEDATDAAPADRSS